MLEIARSVSAVVPRAAGAAAAPLRCRGLLLGATPADAGTVMGTYTDVPLGNTIDLTAAGTLGSVKWGTNGDFSTRAGGVVGSRSVAVQTISSP